MNLKGQAQAKIIKKSVILFWLLNMTISCKQLHRLELQICFNFSAAHSPVRLDIKTKFYGHVYINGQIKKPKKITDFFMILAWASPFNVLHNPFSFQRYDRPQD